MAEFGKQLRKFRQTCNDPGSPQGKLTQEKFGELVGAKLGISYSGAAVSDWEREKSKIHADNRPVLLAIVTVLHEYGGMGTTAEANQLLKAGNFRNLDPEEEEKIFIGVGQAGIEQASAIQKTSLLYLLLGNLFLIPQDELQELIAKAQQGPSPSWQRFIVFLTRRFSDRLSVFQILKFILWIWVWLLAWVLVTPSLHWPFLNADHALLAVIGYAVGSILVPALIAALTNTNDTEFWREQKDLRNLNLRLYTHQGASIGFHAGYFVIFVMGLLLYLFGWRFLVWMELVAAVFLVALGYSGALLVPYNLFSAFQRLRLRDGWIFFVFVLVGPAWAYFFFETYDILLTRSLGIFIVLAALTIFVAMMAWRYRQSGTTVIPLRWWITFWISFLLCQLLLLWLTQVL